MDVSQLGSFAHGVLLAAFRTHFERFKTGVNDIADAIVISRLGDDIDEFAAIVDKNEAVFAPDEFATIQTSLTVMRLDIRLEYQDAVDELHHGRPALVQTLPSTGRGRPRIYIDPDFLRWAYDQRSTASISRFLRVGRTTVRNALLEHGIAQPQESPFQQVDPPSPPASTEDTDPNDDDILDPDLPIPSAGEFPPEVQNMVPSSQPTTLFTGPVSEISDDELDMLLLCLRTHYRRAGLSMLNGMLH
ncbi:hypothetical protein DFH08DRAFT_953131 [Mycena albidolilacea]|uniref:Uncharacterized protein n=1 Tax=Mycena albidolilacea TaxID=1033008 RepID=A0AAD7EZS0_9AGAR|nr:hypothetical protein DFH08DRAFT_953131 [Mycena albidolilacea]